MDATLSCPAVDRRETETIQVQRCRDPRRIARILSEDYFDDPVRRFPARLIRAIAQEWFATSEQIVLMTVQVDQEYAGFVFAHTIGPTLWRQWAREQFPRHALTLASVWLRCRLSPAMTGWRARRQPAATQNDHMPEWAARLPRLGKAFGWRVDGANTGYLDLLLVREPFRGRNLAPRMLRGLSQEMANQGVTLIESHVDPRNYASLRAFMKAGWEPFRAERNDWYLRYRP
jgi:GNAT superfamily N-acetyltransferase